MWRVLMLGVSISLSSRVCIAQQQFFSISWGDGTGDEPGLNFPNLFDDVGPPATIKQTHNQHKQQTPPQFLRSTQPPIQRVTHFSQRGATFQQKDLQDNTLFQHPGAEGLSAVSQQKSFSKENFAPQPLSLQQQNNLFIEQVQTREEQQLSQHQQPLEGHQIKPSPIKIHELAVMQQKQQIAFQRRQHDMAIKKQLDIIEKEQRKQHSIAPIQDREIFRPIELHTTKFQNQQGSSETFHEEASQKIVSQQQSGTIFFPKVIVETTTETTTLGHAGMPLDFRRIKGNNGKRSQEVGREPHNSGKSVGDDERRTPDDGMSAHDNERSPGDDGRAPGDDEMRTHDDGRRPGDDGMRPQDYESSPQNDERSPQNDERRPQDDERILGDDKRRPFDDERRSEDVELLQLVKFPSEQASDLPQDIIEDLIENVSLIENLVKSLGELESLAGQVLYIQEETKNKNTAND